mgnify:CR=1 FL=1
MPTCIKCEKVMKSGYKKVKTRKFGLNLKMDWSEVDSLEPPNTWYDEVSYECKGGCVVEPVEPDYKDSEEYKEYEFVNRQTNIPDEEQISLFGITMINMFRREMAKMREEKDKLKEELRVLKGEDHYSAGLVCWENINLNHGWAISRISSNEKGLTNPNL